MPPQREDDEWTTIRPRRRNNKAQNDQLKERLAIPVVPLTAFAALEIEHNPIQKAEDEAEAEKRRQRKERQRQRRAQEQQQAAKQQGAASARQSASAGNPPRSGSATVQGLSKTATAHAPGTASGSNATTQGAQAQGQAGEPLQGLVAVLTALLCGSLVRALWQRLMQLLGLQPAPKAAKRRPPASQQQQQQVQQGGERGAVAGQQEKGSSAEAAAAGAAAGAAAAAAHGPGKATGGKAVEAAAAPAAKQQQQQQQQRAGDIGSGSGAPATAAAQPAVAHQSRNAKPATATDASSHASKAPAKPAKPPCDADWARGRFLVSERQAAHADVVSAVALSGDTALSSGYDGAIKVWHWPANGCLEHVRNLTGHSGRVEAVCMEPGPGKRAASSGRDSTLKVWDMGRDSSTATASYYVFDSVRCMSVDWAAGVAALGCQSGSVALWNLEAGRKLQVLKGHKEQVSCLLHSASGQQLFSGDMAACVSQWDLRQNPAANALQLHGLTGRVCSLALAEERHLLYVGDYSTTVKVFDLRQAQAGGRATPLMRVPNAPVFAGGACPVGALHCDTSAGVLLSSSIGWWTANKEALEEAPSSAAEPAACLNVHALRPPAPAPAPASSSASDAPPPLAPEYLYTLRLRQGVVRCSATAGFGAASGLNSNSNSNFGLHRVLFGLSNGALLGLSLVRGAGNKVQPGEGMALHEGLPLGLEEHSDDEDEDSDEEEEEEGDE